MPRPDLDGSESILFRQCKFEPPLNTSERAQSYQEQSGALEAFVFAARNPVKRNRLPPHDETLYKHVCMQLLNEQSCDKALVTQARA